jgi:hypothetical protein
LEEEGKKKEAKSIISFKMFEEDDQVLRYFTGLDKNARDWLFSSLEQKVFFFFIFFIFSTGFIFCQIFYTLVVGG